MNKKEIIQMAENDVTFYEDKSETYAKLARLSLAGSYVTFLAGPMTIASEQSPSSLLTGTLLVGCGFMLKELKDQLRTSQHRCDEQATKHQELADHIAQLDSSAH